MAYPSDRSQAAAIAVTRFGLGARPGELADAARDPRGWLLDQIRPAGADQPQPSGETAADRLGAFRDYQRGRPRGRKTDPAQAEAIAAYRQAYRQRSQESAAADFLARARLGATTHAGFRERWTLFWCNHFTVSGLRAPTNTVVGPFEQEAIRPNVFGRFEDLLLASTAHPGMLTYLDQDVAIGPGSEAAAIRARRRAQGKRPVGLNENLAREVLELHSVGVDGGYGQADVTELARALTGWSIGAFAEPDDQWGRFVFRPNAHEPGARTVMGRTYPAGGAEQATAILKALAAHPATARHLSRKLAVHFVADDPPPALVARLEEAWRGSDGDLSVVARTLVEAPQAWAPAADKFKAPYEFLISSWRTIDGKPAAPAQLTRPLLSLGQRAFAPPSPKGWSDEASTWAAPDAVLKRLNWSADFAAATAGEVDPVAVAEGALGRRLTPAVRTAVARAESREEALTVLLMSPEFQRR